MFEGRNVGVILSGGNIDMRLLSNVILRELSREGRLLSVTVEIEDQPGWLARIATVVGDAGGNILEVSHNRMMTDMSAKGADLGLVVEARDSSAREGNKEKSPGRRLRLARSANLTSYDTDAPLLRCESRFRERRRMSAPLVGIIMGSQSDWPTLKVAADTLAELGIVHECKIVSAHRTPDRLYAYAKGAVECGLRVIIAGAGGAAHLPGMTASMTPLPVLGVPIETKTLKGMDSLLSIVQMPGGVPVATFAIGVSGARNAALHAAAILALGDAALAERLMRWRTQQTESVAETPAQ